jgi:hypothetical protein
MKADRKRRCEAEGGEAESDDEGEGKSDESDKGDGGHEEIIIFI